MKLQPKVKTILTNAPESSADSRGLVRYPVVMALLALSVIFILGIATPLQAQLFTGSLTGVIRDQNQGTVSGARVTVKNTATSETRTATTSSDGLFSINQLNPGDYDVTVLSTGFATYVQNHVALSASQTLNLNIQLTVGAVSQEVTVSSAPSALDTQDANSNVTFSSKQLLAIPNSSHSALGAVWGTGGVVSVHVGMNGESATSGDQNMNRFALDGGRDMSSAILVDGISLTAGDWGGDVGPPSPEMLREIQVFRNTYDVQYGKTDGGVVSMTTRGGSDSLHGSAYEYWQGASLNANTWDNDHGNLPKSPYSMNQFGGHVGGPIWRAKHIYYFANYEGTRQSSPATLLTTVPTQLEREGNFSQDLNTNGTLSTIYNPFSTTLNPDGSYTRQAFQGNVIPSNLLDPVGQKIASLFPLPNRSGAQNYAAGSNGSTDLDRLDVRSDWVVNNKLSVFGTMTKLWSRASAPVFLGHGLDTSSVMVNPTYRILLNGTYVVSPTFVVNATGAVSTWDQLQITPATIAGTTASILGLPQSLVNTFPINTGIPEVSSENYQQLANPTSLDYVLHNNDFQLNATKTLNRHVIKFGYQMTVQLMNDNSQSAGSFSFGRGLTSGPVASSDSSVTGDAIASMLLGTMSSGSVTSNVVPASAQKYLAWYAEDAWRLTDRLTLNYGLRYEIQFGRTERHNRYNYFDENVTSPLSGLTGLNLKGGLVYDNGSQRGLWDTDYKNLAPRLSVAYQAENNLVVRAGYGIFYMQTISGGPISNTDGYSVTTPVVASVNNSGFVPQNLISNPLPNGLLQPIGSSQGLLTEVGNSVNAFLLNHPTPYVQTYSANVEYQASPSQVFEIGYQGSQGRKLPVGYNLNINQLNPQYLALGQALNTSVANPFNGIFAAGGPIAGPTIPSNQLLRPYPQFTSVSLSLDTPEASSSYNALLAKYRLTINPSLTAVFDYQWSKAIDNTSETGFNSDAARDVYDLSLERSVSAHDVPQYFTGTVVWQFPFGRGKRFGSNMNRIANGVVGNWEATTITSFASGQPLQFSCPNTLSSYGFAVCRPNIPDVNAVPLKNRTLNEWFNTSSSAVSVPAPYTIGDAPRYMSNVREGKLERGDVTLRKSFTIGEGRTISVHATGYNISNTPYYGAATTSIGSPTYGQVNGTAAGGISRTVELGGRFTF